MLCAARLLALYFTYVSEDANAFVFGFIVVQKDDLEEAAQFVHAEAPAAEYAPATQLVQTSLVCAKKLKKRRERAPNCLLPCLATQN